MTIKQLFESVKIKGLVIIHSNYNNSDTQTFHCGNDNPLNAIDSIYWDEEILRIVGGNYRIVITIN